jgi:hypothetical protein
VPASSLSSGSNDSSMTAPSLWRLGVYQHDAY